MTHLCRLPVAQMTRDQITDERPQQRHRITRIVSSGKISGCVQDSLVRAVLRTPHTVAAASLRQLDLPSHL